MVYVKNIIVRKNEKKELIWGRKHLANVVSSRGGEPESERPEPHDLAGAILLFLQDPDHFKIGTERS